jgi:hypothetical protein
MILNAVIFYLKFSQLCPQIPPHEKTYLLYYNSYWSDLFFVR